MTCSGEDFLAALPPRAHAACLYADDQVLCERIAAYASQGLRRGEAVLLVATAAHLEQVCALLGGAGHDIVALAKSGQLLMLDADATLRRLLNNRLEPDHHSFCGVLEPLLDGAMRRFSGVRAYGELVNLLWERDRRPAARTLEQWWNAMIEHYGFRLLCGYRVNPLAGDETDHSVSEICSTHSHLLQAADPARLEESVQAALQEVFHHADAGALMHSLANRCTEATDMAPAHAALLALQDLLPSAAHDVRLRARYHYSCRHSLESLAARDSTRPDEHPRGQLAAIDAGAEASDSEG